MKQPTTPTYRRLLAALLFGVLATGPALASQPAPLPPWEQLSEAQREQLVAPLRERWNGAQPAQRAQMLERAVRWQQMPPEQRQRAHRGMKRWEHMSPRQRGHARALFGRMRTLDAAGRRTLMAQWRAMTPEQKDAWVEANPAPAGDRHQRRRDSPR